jgi:hypothetical protein
VSLNIFPKKLKPYIILPVLVILLTIAAFLVTNSLIKKPDVQRFIIERISDATGFDIRTGDINLNLWRGIGIFINELEARSREGSDNIVASKVIIIFDAGQLLKGSIVPSRLYLFEPKIELAMEEGQLSLKTEEGSSVAKLPPLRIPGIQSVVVDGGIVRIKNIPFHLEDLYFNVQQRNPGSEALTLSGQGKIGHKGRKVPFDLKGTLIQNAEDQSPPQADMIVETGKVPMTWIPWPDAIPATGGAFKARLNVSGPLVGPISVGGHLLFESFRFVLRKGKQEKEISVSKINLDFKSIIKGEEISIPSIQLKTDDMSFSVALLLDLKQEDPYLSLEAKGPFTAFDILKTHFPTPLLPPWIETQLFPMLDAGYARLDLLSIKGNLNQIENLELPQNQDVLKLKFACKNVKLLGLGLTQPLKEISAEVNFERGDMGISGLGARFGSSAIRGGDLGIVGVYGDKPSYEVSVVGSFDLRDLIKQMEMDLIPKEVRRWCTRVQSIAGKLDAQVTVLYETGWEFPQVTSGEFLLRNVKITQKDMVFPLAMKGIDIRIGEEKQGQINGIGAWGKSKFKITGEARLKGGKFDFRRADIYADANFQEILSLIYREEQSPFIFNRTAPLQVSIQKNGGGWSTKGLVSLEGMVLDTNDYFMDPPGTQDRIIFELDAGPKGRYNLKKCIVKLRGSIVEISTAKFLSNKDPFDLKVSLPTLSLADLGLHFKKGAIPAQGHLHGQIKAKISHKKPSTTRVTGKLEGKNLLFKTRDLPGTINKLNFKVGFSGKNINIDSWKMRVGQSRLNIGGALKGWDGLKGALKIKSSYLNASDFWRKGSPPPSEDQKMNGNKKGSKRDIRVKLDVQRGVWKKLKWGPLNASLDIKGDGFNIRNSNVKMEHGNFTLKGHVREKKKPALFFSSYIRLNAQPLDELLDSIEVTDKHMKGNLTLEAMLYMKGKEPKDLISNLSASSNVLIEHGVVEDQGVMIKVLDFLSLQKIFKKNPPNVSKEGFYFDSAQWHSAVSKGQLKMDNFLLKSPAFNAVAKGNWDMPQDNMDFELGAQPLQTLDSVVSNIPILGYILSGEDKSILTYYFKVNGSMADPKVTYVPFRNLGSGVAGTFKRLFLTPVRIFKDIRDSPLDASDLPDQATSTY